MASFIGVFLLHEGIGGGASIKEISVFFGMGRNKLLFLGSLLSKVIKKLSSTKLSSESDPWTIEPKKREQMHNKTLRLKNIKILI